MELVRDFITNPWVIVVWIILMLGSVTILLHDLRTNNPEIMSVMKLVWILTVIYSGPLGLTIYYFSGRKQIAHDSIWRKGFRSTSHCYSGCGAGEIVGVIIAAGVFSLGNWWISGITFVLAYAAGFTLTIIPLMQDGESFSVAFKDAIYSETASITVMELVAIGVDLWLAGSAKIHEPLFWSSLVVSLSLGLVAAFPVNVLLIKFGIKEGMHNPKEMAEHMHQHHKMDSEQPA